MKGLDKEAGCSETATFDAKLKGVERFRSL
jgi:hypothetical protein